MLNRLSGSLLALLLMLAACAPEPTGPGAERAADREAIAPPPSASVTQSALRDDLALLSQYIVPNPQSILSKFDALVAVVEAGTSFDAALADLIAKIDLEYAKYTSPPQNGNPNQCVQPPGGNPCDKTLAELYVQVIRDIYLYVGLLDPGANICALPQGHDAETCEIPKAVGEPGKGFVYFPPGLFSQLTFVSIRSLGEEGVESGLDEYGVTLEIRTAPISSFPNAKPTVVACVPQGLQTAVLNRILLGHRRTEEKGGGFSLLPEADLGEISLEDYAVDYCGSPQPGVGSSGPSFFGMSAESPVGRLLSRAGSFLLPEQLSATNAMVLATRGFSGASGSPEEFSTFRAVDRGVTGAGGSPEEFTGTDGPNASIAAWLSGEVGTQATQGLPAVVVQTPGLGRGVNGVRVIFEIVPTTSAALKPDGGARFCQNPDGTRPTSVTVVTGTTPLGSPIDGNATLPCIDFGDTPGFVNLRATFDPSVVFTDLPESEQPCMIDEDGECSTELSQSFLIESLELPAELSCALGSRTNKVSLANYNGTTWSGYFEFTPELAGRVRQVTLYMSVTGQSSGLSNFPVTLTAHRGSHTGTVLAQGTRVLNSSHGNIQLPGDNGNYYPVVIGLVPTPGVAPAAGGKMIFKLEVTAPSNRTPQLWYRSDRIAAGDPCETSIVYARGMTPQTAANRDIQPGLGVVINNTYWTP